MSEKPSGLVVSTNVPTTLTTLYTTTANLQIYRAHVMNTTGSSIDLTLTLDGFAFYNAHPIPSGTQAVELVLANHGAAQGRLLQAQASAANLQLYITGRDF